MNQPVNPFSKKSYTIKLEKPTYEKLVWIKNQYAEFCRNKYPTRVNPTFNDIVEYLLWFHNEAEVLEVK